MDAAEAGVANVNVEVRSADGAELIAGMKTEANGSYSLPLPVGNYVLKVVAPPDHGFTKGGATDLGGAGNSGVGPETGTAEFSATAQSPVTVNAGVIRTAAPGRGNDFAFGFAKTISGQVAGPNAVAVDAAGNTFLVGYTASTVSPQDPISDPYVAKYDVTGKLLWKKPVGAAGYVPRAVSVDPAGNAYVTGVTKVDQTMGVLDAPEPTGPRPDVFVEKFAADGPPAGGRRSARTGPTRPRQSSPTRPATSSSPGRSGPSAPTPAAGGWST